MEPALDAAVRTAAGGEDYHIAATLLSVATGLDTDLRRSDWNMEGILATVGLLGRLPEDAPARLVLSCFFGHQQWRDRYSDLATRLHDFLPRQGVKEQRAMGRAWAQLALQCSEEQMCDKYTMARIELPVNELQQSLHELVKRADRSTFSEEARKDLHQLLSRLSAAHRSQQLGRASPAPGPARLSAIGSGHGNGSLIGNDRRSASAIGNGHGNGSPIGNKPRVTG